MCHTKIHTDRCIIAATMDWVGSGRVGLGRNFAVFDRLGPLKQKILKNFESVMLMHLKHGSIRFGYSCTKQ